MPDKRIAVVVAGMHRSGTSALTRVINLAGVDIASELIPEGIGNERGHWESRAAQDLHNAMLAELQSDIYSPVDISAAWFGSEAAKTWTDRIEQMVRRDYAASRLFVVKDPRLALFLPLWTAALDRLGIEPRFVLPFRSPLAVAASLEQREERLSTGRPLPLHQGVALWLRYTLAAERHSRCYRRSFVAFDTLLRDWRSELGRIGDQLGIVWPRMAAGGPDIDRFLDKGHRDIEAAVQPAADLAVPDVAWRVHESLGRRIVDPEAPEPAFDEAARLRAIAHDMFGAYALAGEREAAGLRNTLDVTLHRHALEMADAHRAFDAEIRLRDARIADAARHGAAQEARMKELHHGLEMARRRAGKPDGPDAEAEGPSGGRWRLWRRD